MNNTLNMNERHRAAMSFPCRYQSNRSRHIYAVKETFGESEVLTHLTVNLYGGVPVWQVSAALEVKPGEPVNMFVKMPRPDLRALEAYLLDLLAAVGRGVVWHRHSIKELNYFKTLSNEEMHEI